MALLSCGGCKPRPGPAQAERPTEPKGVGAGPGKSLLGEVRVIQEKAGEGRPVYNLAFTPDGKVLAAANQFRLRLWEASTGRPRAVLKEEVDEQFGAVVFVSKGKLLASGGGRGVRLWEWARHGEVRRAGFRRIRMRTCMSLSASADGKRLAACSDGVVRIWRVTPWKLLRTLKHPRKQLLTSLALSPNGKLVAGGEVNLPVIYPEGYKAEVFVWNARTGVQVKNLPGFVGRLAFSPNGKRLAAIQGGGLRLTLWDLTNSKVLRRCKLADFVALDIAFSPDGRLLASGGLDGSVCFWETDTGKLLERVREEEKRAVYAVAFSPDGRWFAVGDDRGKVRIWRLGKKRESG
jgi:WD40 repeat protein